MDVEDLFQQWRHRHMKTVERIIGFKRGTGGSSGVAFSEDGAGAGTSFRSFGT
jgi:tryptophan 2,3-dioxygenase